VLESDPKEDLEEDDDEDLEEDPADYPANRGDDGDDEDESFDDDEYEEAPSAEETRSFETDESAATPPPHPAYRVTPRISIRDKTPISLPHREEIPSPPLPVSSPVHVLSLSPPTSPIRSLGYRATMIQLRAEAASTSHSLPLPPPIIPSHTRPDAPPLGTPHVHLLSVDHRADIPEMLVDMPGALATDDTEMGRRMTEFTTRVRDRHAHARIARLKEDEARIDYKAIGSRPQEAGGDYKDAGGRSQEAEAVHRGTKAAEEASNLDDRVQEIAGTRQRSCTARCTRGGW
ncbi:hypothetical protein Tco_1572420, partial [Tanacetum coccineum]